MTQFYKFSNIFILMGLLFGSLAQASELGFAPDHPTLETLDQMTITISGTSGDVVGKALKDEIQSSSSEETYIAPSQSDSETIIETDKAGNSGTLTFEVGGFIELQWEKILFFLIVGFIGGLVSGFIGASGAFILTPAMMSMGVPAVMAVASNMCHKFPRALSSAMRRTRYGEVDLKLALIMALSTELGVFCGALLQIQIQETFGQIGSNLYVSFVFILVLAIFGGYALRETWKMYQVPNSIDDKPEALSKWAKKLQSIQIPGTMMYFSSIGTKISILFTIPIGFVAGLLGATIAVSGFIGMPAMMYFLGTSGLMASATQLVMSFVIGFGGTIQYGLDGLVDIRLAMILLAGSFFGFQLGSIGTTYAKDYMAKAVLGVIMALVLVSFLFKLPVYFSDLGFFGYMSVGTLNILNKSSLAFLLLALGSGTLLILYAYLSGYLKYRKAEKVALEDELVDDTADAVLVADEKFPTAMTQLSPTGRFEKIMVVTDNSKFSSGATREAIRLAQRADGHLIAMSVVGTNPEHESLAKQLLEKEKHDTIAHLEKVRNQAQEAGINCDISVRYGVQIFQEIVDEAEQNQMDVIVMGRRGYTGLMRVMMGSNTAKVIGYAECSVLIVPRAAQIKGHKILVAVDGSRFSDIAAEAAINVAKHLHAPILVVSIVYSDHKEKRHTESVEIIKRIEAFVSQAGIEVEGKVLSGRPAEAIIEIAKAKGVDLIIMGSHGRTGLDKLLMGSVSDRVIGLADCAVLVVKT
jgi:hypothetical protein